MPREHTDRLAELGAFIREQRENARLSVRRLSELAEVSNPYLSQIERGLRRPSAEILQQIAKGLKISAETLYVRAGILDPQHHEGLEEAIAQDPRLTRAQKEAMLGVYRSFVGLASDAAGEGAPEGAGERARTAGHTDALAPGEDVPAAGEDAPAPRKPPRGRR
jgi:transcriptional regulator with XRE-family HTH domain